MAYLSSPEQGEEQDGEPGRDTREARTQEEVGQNPGQAFSHVVGVVEEVDGAEDRQEDDAKVQRDKVPAREETRERVEPKDVDGAVDGQEDKEGT